MTAVVPFQSDHTKTRVFNQIVQTRLTTDTVISDNVFDLALGGLQDNNIHLIHTITMLVVKIDHRQENYTALDATSREISYKWKHWDEVYHLLSRIPQLR